MRGRVNGRIGSRFKILTSAKIEGQFGNPDDEVIADDGARLKIHYANKAVTVEILELPLKVTRAE
jgi:hypothetical protein